MYNHSDIYIIKYYILIYKYLDDLNLSQLNLNDNFPNHLSISYHANDKR